MRHLLYSTTLLLSLSLSLDAQVVNQPGGGGSGGGSSISITASSPITTYAAPAGTCTAGNTYYSAGYSFVCVATNTWQAFWGTTPVTVPPQSGWTAINSATSTINGTVFTSQGAIGTTNITSLCRTPPVTPYTLDAAVLMQLESANFNGLGIGFRESVTSKLSFIDFRTNSGITLSVDQFTDDTHFSADNVAASTNPPSLVFFQINADGTNLKYRWSADGTNFKEVRSELKGAFFTTAPDQICMNVYQQVATTGTVTSETLVSWNVH